MDAFAPIDAICLNTHQVESLSYILLFRLHYFQELCVDSSDDMTVDLDIGMACEPLLKILHRAGGNWQEPRWDTDSYRGCYVAIRRRLSPCDSCRLNGNIDLVHLHGEPQS